METNPQLTDTDMKNNSNETATEALNWIDQIETGNSKKDTECSERGECALYCFGGLTTCSVILGLITFTVFCIISISVISLKTTQNRCPDSDLWLYMLLSIVIPVWLSLVASKKEKKTMADSICMIISELSILCWGTYEVFGVSCVSNLEDILLYKMSFARIIVGWSVMGGLVLGGSIVCITSFREV